MKNCIECGKELKGKQKKFCSNKCNSNNFYKKNPNNTKKWNEKNPEKRKEMNNKASNNFYKKNPEYKKEKIREWREKYPERNKEINNKGHIKFKNENPDYYKKYNKIRIKIDINYRISKSLRNQFIKYMKLYTINGKTMVSKKYGLDWSEIIKQFIEKRLLEYDKWDKNHPDNPYTIDHIIPLSKCNHNNLEDIKKFYGINNLQWMKLKDNISKGNR